MKKYRVKPDSNVNLKDLDPDDRSEFQGDKQAADVEVEKLTDELDGLQERLYAESTRAVLFVIQAMDTGGKDGVLRRVAAGTLWLLYTGGEIFARPDFLQMYTYAKQKGLLVTLFTTPSQMRKTIARRLTEAGRA